MKRYLTYILMLLVVLVTGACSEDLNGLEGSLNRNGKVTFAANSSRLITKSGLEYTDFEKDTKYLLFGQEADGSWEAEKTIMYNREAQEDDEHLIDYGEDIFFDEKSFDFYGATICSTTEYPASSITGGPVIGLEVSGNDVLPDLMYSNNLKGCTARDGVLDMNFIHALSKIQIEVSKQNESEELKYAKIHSLTIGNTHGNGNLDVVTGSWALPTETISREFSRSQISLSTTGEMVKDASGAVAEMLIFPNEDGELISLEVEYSLDEAATKKTASIEIYKPGTTSNEVFMFRQNHRYTLAVTIANDGVQVVTVLPKVYEWTDVTVPHYLGQPAYIGGLMWMDRNLGALSADYYGDWYNTVGHYFQFGRNVPYILDVEKFKEYTGDGGKYSNSDIKSIDFTTLTSNIYVMYYNDTNVWNTGGNATQLMKDINEMARSGHFRNHNVIWDGFNAEKKTELILNAVQCIYTYDHQGNPVYGSHYVKPTDTRELLRYPNDYDSSLSDEEIRESYKFGYGSKKPNNETLKNPTNWTFFEDCGRNYWKGPDYEKDPCPKGWRLPTTEDVYKILPRKQMSWNGIEQTETTQAVAKPYPQKEKSTAEEIWYGNYNSKKNHVCYIMKNPGTNQAYRLRIMSHLNKDGNKRYFSVSRYGISEEDKKGGKPDTYWYLDKYLDGSAPNGTNKESTLWANPIETIYFPACGFLVPDLATVDGSGNLTGAAKIDLRSFGNGTVLRTSDANSFDYNGTTDGVDAFSYVQYMSTTDYQLGVQKNSRRSLGDQIRCVRDITAED